MKISPFDLCQKILYLDGEPFNLSERQYLKSIYNSPVKRHVYRFGRQCEKSSSLASKMSTYGTVKPGFKTMYVSPTSRQTRVFSSVRLKEFLNSPFIKKNRVNKDCEQAVFKKSLSNNAQFFLEYTFHTPDRVRGISADWVLIDEIQDIMCDFIPVIEECASHSRYKYFTYAGTPKTMDNTIEYYWEQSTQRELATKCGHCNYWNVGLGLKNIGKEGLICAKCERLIDRSRNEWVRAMPLDQSIYEGFHLNQLNVPWVEWDEILVKKDLYPPDRFHNEVLGLPYDSGTKPITMSEVLACCQDRPMTMNGNGISSPTFAGIDWAVTGDISYSVIVIGEYIPFPNIFKIHYAKIYGQDMNDPKVQVRDMLRICKEFNVAVVGADWGAGAVQNLQLMDVFGPGRVIQFYHTGNQQERIKYNKKRNIYTTNRTFVMADLFLDFMKKKIQCFKWEDFKNPFAQHILNISQEVRKTQQKETLYYDHRPDKQDDFFHALLFGKLAADIFYKGRAV